MPRPREPRPPTGRPLHFVALLLAACGDGRDQDTPTFAADIAGLVHTSCTPCHREGQPAPFSLLDYDDVYRRRQAILEVTSARWMPPWLPSHGDFEGDRRLRDQDIAMLRRWVEAGAPRGDEAREPPPPVFPDGWQLPSPDLVTTASREIAVPADGPETFRNFVLPAAVADTKYVAAVEIRPGSAAVHHAVLAVDATGRARRLDAASAEPGFPGMDMAGSRPPDGYFLGWTPGKRTRRSPDGTCWRLQPGEDLVLQLHLVPTGKREVLRPSVALWFTDVPPATVSYALGMFAADIDLPPGADDVAVRDHFVLPVPVAVRSIYPHAHYLCRTMAAWATLPDGARRDLFRIDRWDFDWQDDYTYRQPVELPAGARIEFEYRYDNSADNPANPSDPPRHVKLGDRSVDEMGNLTLQVTTRDHDARRKLGEACVRRSLEKRPGDGALLLELAVLLRETGRTEGALRTLEDLRRREPGNADALCELGTCLVVAGRIEEAERTYAECVRLDAGQHVARVQWANLLLRTGRAEPAIALYEDSLRLGFDSPSLHNNLATACMAAGRLDRAELHYRRTVAADATFASAWFNLGRVLAAQGRTAEAREALLRARSLRFDEARIGAALQQLGR